MSEENKTAVDWEAVLAGIANVTSVSEGEQEKIKRNSAYALPDSPAEYGMRADTVKPAFWRAIVGSDNSVVAFLNRLAGELNTDLGTLRTVLLALVAADTALGGKIDGEAAARAEADTALDEALEGKLDTSHDTSESAHANLFEAAKQLVSNLVSTKLSKSSKKQVVYINNADGEADIKFYTQFAKPNTFILRNNDGYFRVLDAKQDFHPASWGQVRKRLENLEAGLDADVFVTDATSAYQKIVPASVFPYAAIEKISGAAVVDEKATAIARVTEVVSRSPNLIDEKAISLIKVEANIKRYGWSIPVEEGGKYTLSVYGEYDLNKMAIAYKIARNGVYTSVTNLTTKYKTRTIQAIAGDKILVYVADGYTALQPNQTLQLNKDEDVPYQPYFRDTFQIPAEVRALRGYGEANPDDPAEANYIDLEAGKFVAYGYMDDPDADYPDFKVWVPYEEPVETDISAYLPAYNLIRVAAGGTLTFVNSAGLAVPSTVTYQRKEIAE